MMLIKCIVWGFKKPLDELQKSYDQFLQRMERHRKKRIQREERRTKRPLFDRNTTGQSCSSGENNENLYEDNGSSGISLLKKSSIKKEPIISRNILTKDSQNLMPLNELKKGIDNKLHRDDSVVAKFVDSAIVGRSEAEDACHHGLVEPTINMKEAMNTINSMFKEPIEPANAVRKTYKGQSKVDQSTSNVLAVFIDENPRSTCQTDKKNLLVPQNRTEQTPQEPLKIFVDDELSNDSEPSDTQISADGSPSSSSRVNAFVFLRPQDHQSESSNEMKVGKSSRKTRTKFREDTVVRRFVGSAILDEPEVENICHHGLVDPTVNLKEAMEDINGMFGKPIDFVRTTRRKRQEKAAASGNNDFGGFSILADDEFNTSEGPRNSSGKDNHDSHEPTVFTKEAMDDINNLFKMPLDF